MNAHLHCRTTGCLEAPDQDLALWPGLAHSSVGSPPTLGPNIGFSK